MGHMSACTGPSPKHLFTDHHCQALSFSSMTYETLKSLNVKDNGVLKLKTDSASCVTATVDVGKGEQWSSEGLYCHLCMLQDLVPKTVRTCDGACMRVHPERTIRMKELPAYG